MGNNSSSASAAAAASPAAAPSTIPEGCPMHQSSARSGDTPAKPLIPEGCPMHQANTDRNANSLKSAPATFRSECPMRQAEDAASSNEINPDNMMPPPNQLPSPGQPFSLSTERQMSTIPKGNADENWTYPSEQMFWNAMIKKGWQWKDADITPDAMSSIIVMHNRNNEEAWHQIKMWEAMRYSADGKCACPRLLRFGGLAQTLSPRARFRTWLGYEKPFDRHDWVVDRCGTEVRYIIDYYDGKLDPTTGKFAHLDVRPALDSWTAAWDRMKAAYLRWRYADPILPTQPPQPSKKPLLTDFACPPPSQSG